MKSKPIRISVVVGLACLFAVTTTVVQADQRVTLKSGLTLQGLLAEIASLNQNPFQVGGQGSVKARPILLVDDGLRRIYVHRRGMVVGAPQDVRSVERTIEFKQSAPLGGKAIQGIGDILGSSKFNEFGRRSITIRGPAGDIIEITQGISELNSRYAKVEALKARPAYQWDMRVATSTIPSDELLSIFRQRMDQTDFDRRLEIVRFFIEAGRFGEAETELRRTMRDFPNEPAMKSQLIGIVAEQAKQLISEAKGRAAVGQEKFARDLLERFPLAAVGRTLRISISDELRRLDETDQLAKDLIGSLRDDIAQLPQDQQTDLKEIVDEMEANLSSATLPRLNDYNRLRDADTVNRDSRIALAVAGWLLGPGSGEQNLLVTKSLYKIRNLVTEYLGGADQGRRQAILQELSTMEGAQVEYIARMLPLIEPPMAWPDGSAQEGMPGFYRVTGGPGEPSYSIQLPPEYDPLREYPTIIALAPPNAPPEIEMEWWAGAFDSTKKVRGGHALRNGYIVVTPSWSRAGQRTYEYTPREHYAVLAAVRHAMRRASIDLDRVFLSGHAEGATAAWDIALSHPDIWAGLISINGEPAKTIQHYSPNARNLPMYFVMGESSGPKPPLIRMGPILDDYMHVRNDATVVMYRGRGREHFFEEIPALFEWMNASTHARKPMPQDFEAATMRTGDQYFWWLELGPLKPLVDINPVLWDFEERIRAGKLSGRVGTGNQIRISGPCERYVVWLRPDMGIDLNQQVVIHYGGRTPGRFDFDGSLETLLEDTRQRADRKRPFWAKVTVP